jgi:hypothetical protein
LRRLAGGAKAGQYRDKIGRRARKIVFGEWSWNEIDTQSALVDRSLPRQLDASKPAIAKFGDDVRRLIQQDDVSRYRPNAGSRQSHQSTMGSTAEGCWKTNATEPPREKPHSMELMLAVAQQSEQSLKRTIEQRRVKQV